MNRNSDLLGDYRGVVSVSREDKHIFQATQGYRDLANKIPNTVETRFGTASLGKGFVAVGILDLVAKGEIGLDSHIGRLLAWDWKGIDPEITVAQLLTHTSGMPDYFDEEIHSDYEALWTDFPNYRIRRNADLLPLFIDQPMISAPGAAFRYNNAGYVVLALILEKITEQPFDHFLETAVFKPAGMTSTGYFELDRLPSQCAHNYILDASAPDGYRTNIFSVDAKGTGAGGIFTTVADLAAFWQALTNHVLLDEKHTSLLLHPHVRLNDGEAYGFGVWLDSTINPYLQGFDPGVSAFSGVDLGSGTITSLLSNFGDDPWPLQSRLRTRFVAANKI